MCQPMGDTLEHSLPQITNYYIIDCSYILYTKDRYISPYIFFWRREGKGNMGVIPEKVIWE